MGYFSPGNHVHWIQAKRAIEDRESWRAVWVFEVGVDLLVVGVNPYDRFGLACLSDCIPLRLRERLALTGRLPAEHTRRWSLLGYGKALVSVRGPLRADVGEDLRATAVDWHALDQWRAIAGTGCDSPIRPCACRPDIATRRPPGPVHP
ncbi:hypothetical protein ER308_16590 [Egibacter rhizosphaerae]|uniref:Uncharacterized protein n=1 Tax=Egibacter rhizosphaerae TaxID=1670831 RepID=A0A411YIH0_9ACTN|nr:hypothetical protein [Egibacter rhizosphaerae]QBI21030.1 hypothetical protein ER308_16590 [Egibacter rhizosphaerae]